MSSFRYAGRHLVDPMSHGRTICGLRIDGETERRRAAPNDLCGNCERMRASARRVLALLAARTGRKAAR